MGIMKQPASSVLMFSPCEALTLSAFSIDNKPTRYAIQAVYKTHCEDLAHEV